MCGSSKHAKEEQGCPKKKDLEGREFLTNVEIQNKQIKRKNKGGKSNMKYRVIIAKYLIKSNGSTAHKYVISQSSLKNLLLTKSYGERGVGSY